MTNAPVSVPPTEQIPAPSLPDTPAGARAAWLLDQLVHPERAWTVPDLQARVAGDDPAGFLTWIRSQVLGPRLVSVQEDSPTTVFVRVEGSNDRRWEMTFVVEHEAPHRLQNLRLQRALPEGMEVRVATPADNDGIVAVCRATPLSLRSSTVVIDPGDDYFAYLDLMERHMTMVATDHGNIVGLHCGATYPIRYGGEVQRMSQILHSRMLPQYAGLGLWSVMNGAMIAATRGAADRGGADEGVFLNGCAYFHVDNDAARRLNGAQSPWKIKPFRVTLPCAALVEGGPAIEGKSRSADVDDAEMICWVLNACHDAEELFLPYTVESLTARLTRAPHYSWSQVRIGDGAVIGMWPAGQRRVVTASESGDVRVTTSGLVLDYGFLPAHEESFVELLQRTAADALAAGMTHLSMFSSDPSPGSSLLRSLADGVDPYEVATPYTDEPATAATGGVYVDQVYF